MDFWSCFLLLFFGFGFELSGSVYGKVLKNKIFGQPKAICGQNDITVMIETELPFSGNVYAKGFFDKPNCRVMGDGVGNTVNITIPITGDCGMRRKRNVAPRGLTLDTTVVIMFHKLFLTRADKAFHIDCQYQEQNEILTQKLDVSMIPTTDVPSDAEDVPSVPKCIYEVLENDENGPPLTFAVIGQPVYHRWTCKEADSKRKLHCLTVHSCVVDDGQGVNQTLLDERGCPTDEILLDTIDYKDDLEAGRESFVFKFADKPTIFFSCQLRVELKESDDGKCKRTSDDCSEISESNDEENDSENTPPPPPPKSKNKKKKSKKNDEITADFPRPTTPLIEVVSTTLSPEDVIDEPDDEDFDDLTPTTELPNSSEKAVSRSSGQVRKDEPRFEETTLEAKSIIIRKKPKKMRRPARRAKDDALIGLPEFVDVERELEVRNKEMHRETVNMDVTAGAVDVIDMPEIPVNYRPVNNFDNNLSPTVKRDIGQNGSKTQVCIPRTIVVTALFVCTFFLLTCISCILFLFWRFTKLEKHGKGSITSSNASSTSPSTANRSINAFSNSL